MGVAGIQAALDIVAAGRDVVLVERSPSIGGHMAQLDETFPTLDCSQCILTPKMVDLAQNTRAVIHTYSEIESVKGFVGNFKVTVRQKAKTVDHSKCTGCGTCMEKCPTKVPSEFDCGLSQRKAIYVPFPQAIPNKPVIDRATCLWFTKGRCKVCEKVCPVQAVDFKNEDRLIEEEVGAIVVATGYDLIDRGLYGEYGRGEIPDVIDGLQFERMLSASGPTGGKVIRPSTGEEPKTVVFIQCVGSRDESKGLPYCSRICCMYAAKHAMLFKHKVKDGKAFIFYIDIRAAGKGYEEFVNRAVEEDRVVYLRGRVSKMYEKGGSVVVKGADTLSGQQIEIKADLVVMATAVTGSRGVVELAQKLRVGIDQYGFLTEAHPKLRPVETNTPGIYLAGACQAPKDIPDAVSQASAAASKVLGLLSSSELVREPLIAQVDESICIGCFACEATCPYGAVERVKRKDAESGARGRRGQDQPRGLRGLRGVRPGVPAQGGGPEGFQRRPALPRDQQSVGSHKGERLGEAGGGIPTEDRGLPVQLVLLRRSRPCWHDQAQVPGRREGDQGALLGPGRRRVSSSRPSSAARTACSSAAAIPATATTSAAISTRAALPADPGAAGPARHRAGALPGGVVFGRRGRQVVGAGQRRRGDRRGPGAARGVQGLGRSHRRH